MRIVLLLICILIIPPVAAASGGDVAIQGDLYPLNITPTFDHGYLAVYEMHSFAVYKPDGSLAMRTIAPDGGSIVNVDIDSDGSVAAASHGSRTGGISIFNPDGSLAARIDTGPYLPSHVCFAPDHSLWTLGNEDKVRRDRRPDYFLLQHYSRAGELLGGFLPRSSFPAESNPGGVMVGMWRLRIAGGRIGAALPMGPYKGMLWLETDLNGVETGRWAIPPSTASPAAMTSSGAVYISSGGMSTLDRAGGAWKPVERSSNDILLGAEGNTLVFAIRGTNQIRWAAQP